MYLHLELPLQGIKSNQWTNCKMNSKKGERERFIPSHNIVKICSQNHCALQFVRLEEQHGHN